RGMRGDIKVDHAAPVMCQHQKHVQYLESDRRHRKEVDRNQVLDVIIQKGTPGLRRRLAPPHHILRYAGLTDLDAEFQQFAVDAGGAPRRILTAHLSDPIANLAGNRRPTRLTMPDPPSPVKAKSLT